MRLLHCGVDLG